MRSILPAVLVLFLAGGTLPAQDDETDRLVDGKRASEWMALLRNSKEIVMRYRALRALEKAGPQTRKVFEEVGSALRLDTEERIRLFAAQVLGKLGGEATGELWKGKIPLKPAVDALSSSLSPTREKSARVRQAVATSLGRIGPEAHAALPTLGESLKDENADVRAAAAEAIADMGAAGKEILKVIVDIIQTARGKEELRVRAGLVRAVKSIGRPDGLPAVTVLIGVLGEPVLADLSLDERKSVAEFRRNVVETLGVLGDLAALDVLTVTFNRAMDEKDTALARASITAITQLAGEKAKLVPILLEAMKLQSGRLQDRFVRCEAIHTLGQLGKDLGTHRKSVVAELSAALTDKLGDVKLAAILALGELGPEVVGEHTREVVAKLMVLKRSSEKPIAEAADATLKRLEKQ